jgi:hypothetical protein
MKKQLHHYGSGKGTNSEVARELTPRNLICQTTAIDK